MSIYLKCFGSWPIKQLRHCNYFLASLASSLPCTISFAILVFLSDFFIIEYPFFFGQDDLFRRCFQSWRQFINRAICLNLYDLRLDLFLRDFSLDDLLLFFTILVLEAKILIQVVFHAVRELRILDFDLAWADLYLLRPHSMAITSLLHQWDVLFGQTFRYQLSELTLTSFLFSICLFTFLPFSLSH